VSSIKYKRYKDGKAINNKIIIGITVQTVSNTWESIVYLSTAGFFIITINK